MREAHKQQRKRAERAALDGKTLEELRRRIGHSPEILKRIIHERRLSW